jgi:hypothetical protein
MTDFFEEAGEGSLYVGGNGQGLEPLQDCPVAQSNRPGPSFRCDTSHLSLMDGTELIQWHGRKADGCFHPHGKFLRLTDAGIAHLQEQAANADEYGRKKFDLILRQVAQHRS